MTSTPRRSGTKTSGGSDLPQLQEDQVAVPHVQTVAGAEQEQLCAIRGQWTLEGGPHPGVA